MVKDVKGILEGKNGVQEIKFPDKKEPPKEINWVHNWMYSFLPIGERADAWNGNSVTPFYPLVGYLVGYCKNCRKAFSEKIPTDGDYIEYKTNVPFYGCVDPSSVY